MSDDKSFSALINGIARHDYYDDNEMTDSFLQEQLFPEMPDAEFTQLLNKCRYMVKSLGQSAMDLNQAEAFLTSQVRKRDSGLTEQHATLFLKFWKNNRERVRQSLVNRCIWDNTMKSVNWRIDVKTQARDTEQLNSSTAIVEMQLANSSQPQATELVRFEMDENGLSSVLKSLHDIDNHIQKHIKQNND